MRSIDGKEKNENTSTSHGLSAPPPSDSSIAAVNGVCCHRHRSSELWRNERDGEIYRDRGEGEETRTRRRRSGPSAPFLSPSAGSVTAVIQRSPSPFRAVLSLHPGTQPSVPSVDRTLDACINAPTYSPQSCYHPRNGSGFIFILYLC